MNYELKFYYGPATNNVRYLGSYKLHDVFTYNHYKELINWNVPFSVWFEHYDNTYCHRNVNVDNSVIVGEGYSDFDDTQFLYFIVNDFSKIKFLTREQYNDQNKIDELINQLSREDLGRFLR